MVSHVLLRPRLQLTDISGGAALWPGGAAGGAGMKEAHIESRQ